MSAYESVAGGVIAAGIRRWVDALRADPVWSKVRFKVTTPSGIAGRKLPASEVDVVTSEVYAEDEPDRLPIILGTQFGLSPKPRDLLAERECRRVAVFAFSALSGDVSGLRILTVDRDFNRGGDFEELAVFSNKEPA